MDTCVFYLLALKALLDYLWPMITTLSIHPFVNPSIPIRPTYSSEWTKQAQDWSESTSNDLLNSMIYDLTQSVEKSVEMIVWFGATFILRWSCLDSSFGRLCFFRINKNICFQAWTEINGGNNSIQGIVVEKCFLSLFTSYRIYLNEWPWIQQHFTCIKSKACLQNPVCIFYIHRSVVTYLSFLLFFSFIFSSPISRTTSL